jgi:multicomponent Na+:H+ antiporter subunit E
VRRLSLFLVLFAFWLVLSGHYTPRLIIIGAVTSLLCVAAAARMHVDDEEGHPIDLLPRALTYFPWLIWEICKSAWSVTWIILNPRLPISPTMLRVRAGQRSPRGIGIYGNSITLTPGTLTVAADGDMLTVHALTADGADDLEEGTMDRRVVRFEGAA